MLFVLPYLLDLIQVGFNLIDCANRFDKSANLDAFMGGVLFSIAILKLLSEIGIFALQASVDLPCTATLRPNDTGWKSPTNFQSLNGHSFSLLFYIRLTHADTAQLAL